MRRWAFLLACLTLASPAVAKDVPAPTPKPAPPPVALPERPPLPPPPPVLVPEPPRTTPPNLMDELKTERDLRETERHLGTLERRRDLDPAGRRQLDELRGNASKLRRR